MRGEAGQRPDEGDIEEIMNLHEECLLKYLLNPLDIWRSTELLKLNNSLIEKNLPEHNVLAKKGQINYTAGRI